MSNHVKDYKYYYIYKIINLINKKCYVGFHATNVEYENDSYYGSSITLDNAIRKYGPNNFIKGIIEYVTKENWKEKETYWIIKMNAHVSNGGYNLTFGGDGTLGRPCSEETRIKKSKSMKGLLKGDKNPRFGHTILNTWIEKYGKEIAEIKFQEHLKTVSTLLSGDKNPMFGKKHKKESIEKIKNTLKNNPKLTCPICKKTMNVGNFKKYKHGNNCKNSLIIKN